jgi:hypothetical protein
LSKVHKRTDKKTQKEGQKDGEEKMNICNVGHDEICFEGKVCPMCEQNEYIAELHDQINSLEDEVGELEIQLKI